MIWMERKNGSKGRKAQKVFTPRTLSAVIAVVAILALVAGYAHSGMKAGQSSGITVLTNRANALYGLPNQSSYEFFLNLGPYSNKSQGLNYYFASEYGLNFTAPVMAGSSEPPFDYPLVPPPGLSNSSAPVAMLISVFKYANSSVVMHPIALNGTVYLYNNNYYATANSYDFTTNASTVNISMPNATAYMTTEQPAYANLELNQLNIIYKNYLVIVAVFGIKNRYDHNYTLNIGRHIYGQLQGA